MSNLKGKLDRLERQAPLSAIEMPSEIWLVGICPRTGGEERRVLLWRAPWAEENEAEDEVGHEST